MQQLSKVSRPARMALLLMVALILPGCGNSKVTKANYDSIQIGMTLEEVQGILGTGKKEEGDGAGVAAQYGVDVGVTASRAKGPDEYVWENGEKKISAFFANGKVVNKNSKGL
ncbi:MAG TPA: hypothetical protein VGY77_04040 [Gemmataceae bacterium]|nr:hypothetical protein [Gemmataceae bacterium]